MNSSPAAAALSTRAFGASHAAAPLAPLVIKRRAPGPRDVQIQILYCGVCHSDLHQVRNEWAAFNPTAYPCVPGHEITGRVVAVGAEVSRFREGDLAAVGCMVGSCGECPSCRAGEEQYCARGLILTYNGPDRMLGGVTYGGYSKSIVVDERFVLSLPAGLDPASAAPLLCAGVTTWSPLMHWRVGAGQKVGIIGLGGLGHMGVKFAHAFGAHTVLLTRSPEKSADAHRLGADEVVITRDADQMQRHAGSFDFILDTVSAKHDINAYLALLKFNGTLTMVGAPPEAVQVAAFSLIGARRRLAGSAIGGIRETQQMLQFCADHGLAADIERIRIQEVDAAYERMLRSEVKYRFVIDMASLTD